MLHRMDQDDKDGKFDTEDTNKTSSKNDLTLEAIGLLLDKKNNNLESKIEANIESHLTPIKNTLATFVADLKTLKESVREELKVVALQFEEMKSEMESAKARISSIEAEFTKLKLKPTSLPQTTKSERDLVAVIGNIPGADSFEAARKWVQDFCTTNNMKVPKDEAVFFKSRFTGIVFAKFLSEIERNQFVDAVRAIPKGFEDMGDFTKKTWAKPDQPIDVRTSESVLFAVKRMLVTWGYSKACLNVNLGSSSLEVAGTSIVKVKVKDFSLDLEWADGEWERWDALQSSSELSEIKAAAASKLCAAKEMKMFKGKGKGPASM